MVDAPIRSSMCWWEDPSMLTPLIVMITSPIKRKTEAISYRKTWLLCIVSVYLSVWVSRWKTGWHVCEAFVHQRRTIRSCWSVYKRIFMCILVWAYMVHIGSGGCGWFTCGQPSTLSSAVLLHLAHKRAHFHCRAVPLLQAVGLQQKIVTHKSCQNNFATKDKKRDF